MSETQQTSAAAPPDTPATAPPPSSPPAATSPSTTPPPAAGNAPAPAAHPYRAAVGHTRQRTGWTRWVVFAGVMMIIIGAFQATAGFVALFRDTYYLVTSSGLLVTADYTAWGWIHLVLGLILVVGGLGVMRGAMWGRVAGVVLAGLSALTNLMFLAAYPLWSLAVIAMDIIVIFALIVHGSETKD